MSPMGDRAYIENWPEVARRGLGRLRREFGGTHVRDPVDEELLKMIDGALLELGDLPDPSVEAPSVLYPIRFRRGELALNLFTTIATLGTPVDVTLQEIRVEMFFPADEHSKRVLEHRRR